MPEPAAAEDQPQRDLQALLDQELNRLPEKYRSAIILCDLAGRTRKEVARQLGIPEGTLSGRLSRGRAILARRLARCGLAVSAAALAEPASTAPVAVVAATIRIATGPATLVPARVAALVEGVLKAMLITKLKLTTFVLLAIALLGIAAGVGPWGTATDAGEKEGQPAQVAQVAEPTQAPKPKGDAPARDGNADFEIFPLRHANAANMARTLRELLQDTDLSGLRIIADPASKSVLVRGRSEQYKKLRAIIRRLDQAAREEGDEPAAAGKPTIQVFALKYADAVDMAKTLRELLQGNDAPGLRIAADPGSNSILVRCRRDQLVEVEAILMRLEDAAYAHAAGRVERRKPAQEPAK